MYGEFKYRKGLRTGLLVYWLVRYAILQDIKKNRLSLQIMDLLIFVVSVFSTCLLLVFSLLSLMSENFDFFPPPSKSSWQYCLFWVLFRLMFLGLVVLSFSSFNTISGIATWLRFFVGVPLLILGFGVATYLSIKLGWGLFVNSNYVYIILSLWALIYLLAPFIEEPWLQKRYGDDFSIYKTKVPRFVGLRKKT